MRGEKSPQLPRIPLGSPSMKQNLLGSPQSAYFLINIFITKSQFPLNVSGCRRMQMQNALQSTVDSGKHFHEVRAIHAIQKQL